MSRCGEGLRLSTVNKGVRQTFDFLVLTRVTQAYREKRAAGVGRQIESNKWWFSKAITRIYVGCG